MEELEWLNQLFQPDDIKAFAVIIQEGDKIVYYPSTSAIEEALEKSMA